MKKRFVVLIEDDFEVMGNGLGNVADLQYLPGLALMNIASKHDAKLTFMVDVAHQMVLAKHTDHRSVRLQKELWDQSVLMMKERGFDVQLHLHPQWLDAEYKDGFFYLSDNWNLGCYKPDQQESLIASAVEYLKRLLQPEFPEYTVQAFKAGSWGLQPSSQSLLTALQNNGVKIVMGARDGLTIPGASIEYGNLEEKYLPYHPDFHDVTKKSSSDKGIVMLPLQPYQPGLVTFSKLILDHVRSKFNRRDSPQYRYEIPIPKAIRNLSPLADKTLFKLSMHPYSTHLKIGNQPFSYLKESFDTVVARLSDLEGERIPIVIESHTKQFPGYYDHIDRFFGYINEKYGDEVEFGDMAGFAQELENTPALVRA